MSVKPIYTSLDPIANLNDFTKAQKTAWNRNLQEIFQERIVGYPQVNDGPRTRFFDPTKVANVVAGLAVQVEIVTQQSGLESMTLLDKVLRLVFSIQLVCT